METPSHKRDQLLIPFLPLSFLWKMRGGDESCKRLIRAWSFSWLVPIQEPSRSPFRVSSIEQKMFPVLFSPRKLQKFQSLVSRMGRRARNQCIFFYCLTDVYCYWSNFQKLLTLNKQEFYRSLGARCQADSFSITSQRKNRKRKGSQCLKKQNALSNKYEWYLNSDLLTFYPLLTFLFLLRWLD